MRTSDAKSPLAERVARVAGVSLRAPEASYAAEGLSFGAARLTRDERAGTLSGGTIELALTPEAVERSVAEGGADGPVVSQSVGTFQLSARYEGEAEDALGDGLRELLVEHQLLARPGLLRDEALGEAAPERVTRTLQELQRRYGTFVAVAAEGAGAPCAACHVVQEQSQERRFEAEVRARRAELDARIKDAPDAERSAAEKEFSAWEWETRWKYRNEASFRSCPHAPMVAEAWRALGEAHPELAFELVGVLAPEGEADTRRFTLPEELFRKLLGEWLVGRVRDVQRAFGRAFVPAPSAYPRWSARRSIAHQFSVRRSELTDTIPQVTEMGLRFAASAWDIALAPVRLWREPEHVVTTPTPTLTAEVMPEDALNVQRLIPALAVKPTQKPEGDPDSAGRPRKKPRRTAPG